MQLPQIRMQSSFIQTGLNIKQAVQEIEQPKAIQSIEQPKAVLNIETRKGKLTIDQSQARADMDLKNISQRIEEFAQNGYQDWLAGIARRASQGQELRKIENGGNAIAQLAKQNGTREQKQFNIGWIPSHFSVKLDYQPAEVIIDAIPQRPVISAESRKPIHEYTPGNVEVEVLEYNSLDIDFINLFPEE